MRSLAIVAADDRTYQQLDRLLVALESDPAARTASAARIALSAAGLSKPIAA
jgi:hypothetical protein